MTEDEFKRSYGIEGVHFNVKGGEAVSKKKFVTPTPESEAFEAMFKESTRPEWVVSAGDDGVFLVETNTGSQELREIEIHPTGDSDQHWSDARRLADALNHHDQLIELSSWIVRLHGTDHTEGIKELKRVVDKLREVLQELRKEG